MGVQLPLNEIAPYINPSRGVPLTRLWPREQAIQQKDPPPIIQMVGSATLIATTNRFGVRAVFAKGTRLKQVNPHHVHEDMEGCRWVELMEIVSRVRLEGQKFVDAYAPICLPSPRGSETTHVVIRGVDSPMEGAPEEVIDPQSFAQMLSLRIVLQSLPDWLAERAETGDLKERPELSRELIRAFMQESVDMKLIPEVEDSLAIGYLDSETIVAENLLGISLSGMHLWLPEEWAKIVLTLDSFGYLGLDDTAPFYTDEESRAMRKRKIT